MFKTRQDQAHSLQLHSPSIVIRIMILPCSGVTGGGQGSECPQRLLTGKFLLTYREKKRQGKKGKGPG